MSMLVSRRLGSLTCAPPKPRTLFSQKEEDPEVRSDCGPWSVLSRVRESGVTGDQLMVDVGTPDFPSC